VGATTPESAALGGDVLNHLIVTLHTFDRFETELLPTLDSP
jgi:hypothetical protein